jgi:hypothetical protein
MTLKSDYYQGATGLQQKMKDAFDAGVEFVAVTNYAALQTALLSAAEQGITKFDVEIQTTFNHLWLRQNNGNNLLKKSYFSGIISALADSEIYDYECSLNLNVADTAITKVIFQFNFQTT